MTKASPHFKKLQKALIFQIVEEQIASLDKEKLDSKPLLNFGVGDVAFPIRPTILQGLHDAVDEVGKKRLGYGPSSGYDFLKKAIIDAEFGRYGIRQDEVFISDGIMSDISSLLALFEKDQKIAITDPTYPVYLDATVLNGRTSNPKKGRYSEILYLDATKETNFVPLPPKKKCSIVFLCSPNNPTGCALTRAQLSEWISYAKKHDAILIVDAAYQAFINSDDVPKSIYEIPGSKDVAIELRSFSKTFGFSGLRLSFSVIPEKLKVKMGSEIVSLSSLWKAYQSVSFNGPSVLIQKAGAAALSPKGLEESKQDIQIYLQTGTILKEGLKDLGFECFGGDNSPYIWWQCPEGLSSKDFFSKLLFDLHIVTVPGDGFGTLGEGFVRLSTFNTEENAKTFIERLQTLKI